MITEAQILSVDYTTATCKIRVPLFESPGNQIQCEMKADIMLQPGLSIGYVEGDTVWIGFENDHENQPIVLGLTCASNTDTGTPSAITTSNLTATGTVNLPASAKITDETGKTTTLAGIINNIEHATKTAETEQTITCVGQLVNVTGGSCLPLGYDFELEPATKNYYNILYNGNIKLTDAQAKAYMKFMTGNETLPIKTTNEPMTVFKTVDGRMWYPVWNASTSNLQLWILCDETLDDRINRLIKEYGDQVTVIDTNADTAITGNGATVQYADTTGRDDRTSLDVNVTDLT